MSSTSVTFGSYYNDPLRVRAWIAEKDEGTPICLTADDAGVSVNVYATKNDGIVGVSIFDSEGARHLAWGDVPKTGA